MLGLVVASRHGTALATPGDRVMLHVGLTLLFATVVVGTEPVQFRLQDHRGAWHTLDEVAERKLVVLAFLGVECPLADRYAPQLGELARTYGTRGVACFGIDANARTPRRRWHVRKSRTCRFPS